MKITCEGIFTEQSLGKQSRIKSDRYHFRFAAIFGFHLLHLLKRLQHTYKPKRKGCYLLRWSGGQQCDQWPIF